jgi:DNA-binding transcriptional ArsR family regulator
VTSEADPETPGPVPDYALDDTQEVSDPAGLKAVADRLRGRILSLLNERAATTTELAEALNRPKGTVGYHLKVLEKAGLVRVVRTEKVRAMTAKYYGRTARTFLIRDPGGDALDPFFMVREAMAEWVADDEFAMSTLRRARIPRERAGEWNRRLGALAEEFAAQDPAGEQIFGLLVAMYPTDWKTLPDQKDQTS